MGQADVAAPYGVLSAALPGPLTSSGALPGDGVVIGIHNAALPLLRSFCQGVAKTHETSLGLDDSAS